MNADHFFSIGHSHKVCEDYATSFSDSVNQKNIFAIVSDGCSLTLGRDGKPMKVDTDFGSRFLCRAAYEALRDRSLLEGNWEQEDYWLYMMALEKALVWARAMNFPIETLSATLLIARVVPKGVRVTICGDGVILARSRKDGSWRAIEFSYGGQPYYLRYELNPSVRQEFMRNWQGVSRRVTIWNSSWVIVNGYQALLFKEVPDMPFIMTDIFSREDFDMVGVASDGLGSFTERAGVQGIRTVPLFNVISSLVGFKGIVGEFVNRRARKALVELSEQGFVNQDDVSLAMINLR